MDKDSYIQNMAIEISLYRQHHFIPPLIGDNSTQKDRVMAKRFVEAQIKNPELTIYDWCRDNIFNPWADKPSDENHKSNGYKDLDT